jgi:hypothetical protein
LEHHSVSRSQRGHFEDRADSVSQIVQLVWAHKLWWLIPLVISLVFLGLLLLVQASSVGPMLYPVF